MTSLFDSLDPPAQRHSATSVRAAEEIKPVASTLRRQVFEFLQRCGASGATDEETQDALEMPGSTQRPRRRECEVAGLIVDSGKTRLTRSGRKAVVWVAKEAAHDN